MRIALGAVPAQVRAMVLCQGLSLAVRGGVIGMGGAIALSRFLTALLYGIASRDVVTFALVPLLMLAVSGIAAYVPARRASAVNPLQALGSD